MNYDIHLFPVVALIDICFVCFFNQVTAKSFRKCLPHQQKDTG
jgi:hypothetical protein